MEITKALSDVSSKWIWRIDDDVFPESDVLEKLLAASKVHPEAAALGPLILDPGNQPEPTMPFSSKMTDMFIARPVQHQPEHEANYLRVEHLQGSSFLFRADCAGDGYCLDLSPAGHREEAMFTHNMMCRGHHLIVVTCAIVWHFRHPSGGIRDHNDFRLFDHDEAIFCDYLEAHGIKINDRIS